MFLLQVLVKEKRNKKDMLTSLFQFFSQIKFLESALCIFSRYFGCQRRIFDCHLYVSKRLSSKSVMLMFSLTMCGTTLNILQCTSI